jgi:uncharacterized protein
VPDLERHGRAYAFGSAEGEALVLRAPLSFYGGVAADSGTIIDHGHPDLGKCIADRILLIPGGKGSSSSSSVLAEVIRLKTGPRAIILSRIDPIMVIGCLVAQKLYEAFVPILVCPIDGISDGDFIRVECRHDRTGFLLRRNQEALNYAGS